MAKQLYETFVATACAPMHIVPWEDLPPITQQAWWDVWEKALELHMAEQLKMHRS